MIQPTGEAAATFMRPRWAVGRYYATADSVAHGVLALTLNRLFLTPLDVPLGAKIDRIGCEVTAELASASARLGVYRSTADGLPGSLLLDAGTIDATSIGTKEITLGSPLSLPDGRVFLALVGQGAAASYRTMSTSHDARMGLATMTLALASNGHNAYYYTPAVSGALPTLNLAGTGNLSSGTHGPVVAVRAA